MSTEKRAPRSYKARQTPYVLASAKAKGMNTTLAEIMEGVVIYLAAGYHIQFKGQDNSLHGIKPALFDMRPIEEKLKLPKSKSSKIKG